MTRKKSTRERKTIFLRSHPLLSTGGKLAIRQHTQKFISLTDVCGNWEQLQELYIINVDSIYWSVIAFISALKPGIMTVCLKAILTGSPKKRLKLWGIITKNIDTYSGLIKAIFSKYNIPVYIDEKKDLGQNILIKYIISLLEVFSKNWSYESVIAYIKTKFCDITEKEIYEIEKYARRWEIKYSKWYKEDWKYGESEERLEYLNNIRRKVVAPLLELRNKCYKNTTCKNLSKAIYEFLIQNEVDKKLKEKANIVREFDADLASEYEASFNTVIKILDEMVKVFGDENLSFEKYTSFLKISFSENGLGKIPAGFDEVTVGDVDRSRSHTVKVIFIIGLNDGSFPSVNNVEGFLSDSDREKLKDMEVELAKTTLEALYNDNFNIYKAFTTSEEKLYMSYLSSGSNRRCTKTIYIIT